MKGYLSIDLGGNLAWTRADGLRVLIASNPNHGAEAVALTSDERTSREVGILVSGPSLGVSREPS